MVSIDPNFAANAYMNSAKIATGSAGESDDTGTAGAVGGSAGGDSGGVSFGQLLEDMAHEAVDTMRASEVMSAKAVTGQADVTKVVEAVAAAEVTLQTVTVVRDRMISAYQEIMRMPI